VNYSTVRTSFFEGANKVRTGATPADTNVSTAQRGGVISRGTGGKPMQVRKLLYQFVTEESLMLLKILPLIRSSLKRRFKNDPTPLAVSFLVTARCTLRCRHCFYHYAEGKAAEELTLEEYDRLSLHMGEFMAGLFCGGEPFIRRDLADLIEIFQGRNGLLMAGAATNGQLTDSVVEQTDRICRSRPRSLFSLSLSLDGFRDTHDHIRGTGAYDGALRTWNELRQMARRRPNLILSITTVISSLNQDEAPAFIRRASEDLKPAAVNVLLVRQQPRDGPALKNVDPRRYREAQEAALASGAGASRLRRIMPHAVFMGEAAGQVQRTMLSGRRSFHCHAGTHGAFIDFRGDVNACEVLAEHAGCRTMGNLRDFGMDFRALWACAQARRIRAQVNRHAACRACTHETMGLFPSLLFPPNRLGAIIGKRMDAAPRPAGLTGSTGRYRIRTARLADPDRDEART